MSFKDPRFRCESVQTITFCTRRRSIGQLRKEICAAAVVVSVFLWLSRTRPRNCDVTLVESTITSEKYSHARRRRRRRAFRFCRINPFAPRDFRRPAVATRRKGGGLFTARRFPSIAMEGSRRDLSLRLGDFLAGSTESKAERDRGRERGKEGVCSLLYI